MGNGDDRAFVLVQVLFQPVDTLGIEVVGGFVEEQDIGFLEQQAAEGDSTAFAS